MLACCMSFELECKIVIFNIFSDAKHVDRCRIRPSTLVMLLILGYNKEFWREQTIETIINK